MLNMIRMELYRMFRTKSLHVIWMILAAGIVFTTFLAAEEMKTFTMEEKQEQYEYATGQKTEEQANLGMTVTLPTRPGEEVSVFDLFYANIKGKFIALFIVIFAVLYATADMTSGYVKNIAGQVKNRGCLVLAKAAGLFLYVVLTLLLFAAVQAVSNLLWFDRFVWGPWKEFLLYGAVQTLLHFAYAMIAMCLAIVVRSNVISMAAVVCMCMNVLTMFYGFVDKLAADMGAKDFHLMNYTVSGKILLLPMNAAAGEAGAAVSSAAAVAAVSLLVCFTVFRKRDI